MFDLARVVSDCGLGELPQHFKDRLLSRCREALELKVGELLVHRMSDGQMLEFEGLVERRQDQEVLRWLETTVPDYRTIVAAEVDRLHVQLVGARDALLAGVRRDVGE